MNTERFFKSNNSTPNIFHDEKFGETLTSGFSGVNTRFAFDTGILLLNYAKMSTEQSFKVFKRDNLKVGYKLKLDGETEHSDRRMISKILKLDENNQYGFAITKPMPTGCIIEKAPSWLEINNLIFHLKLLLQTIRFDTCFSHILNLIMNTQPLNK